MAVQLSGRAMVLCLSGMATLWLFMYSPLLARLWPILTGRCGPVPGPVSRWDELWGMGWMRFHGQLVREVARADQKEGFDIIFYGDSITEDWRGTSGGFPWPIGAGTSDVFQKHFGQYRPEVLAIAGDQVGHLWWRILNGEMPVAKQPLVYTVLIGTNDLTAADCNQNETELLNTVPGIAARVSEVVRILRTQSKHARIIIQGLLPRGGSFWGAAQWAWPNRFTKPLAAVNSAFQDLVAADPRMHYVECGQEFVKEQLLGMGLDPVLLPDGLHPNAAGMECIAQCLEKVIAPLMDEQPANNL